MSDACFNTQNEFLNYTTDDRGKAIKLHDHTIDCTRYALKASGFTFHKQEVRRKEKDPIKEGRMISLEQDARRYQRDNDWTYSIMEELY